VHSLLHAAKQKGIEHKYHTVHRRAYGLTKSLKDAHKKQRLLTDAQEKVLVNWMHFLGTIGRPIAKDTIWPYVYDLCGCYPSENWIYRFLKRH
ncbi:hypothetical protein EDD15DRAFT_2126531, partial [Pisolithus albus]